MEAVAERQSEFLSKDEVHELTTYKHAAQQAEWLALRSIPHKLEARRVVLSRIHVRGWLEGHRMAAGSGILNPIAGSSIAAACGSITSA